MNFYNELQLDPSILKMKIKSSQSSHEKARLYGVMALRAVLIVLFAIAFIAPQSMLFGSENSAAAVVIFCILLSVRFVDFGYCISDSLISLGITLAILLFAPVLSGMVNPLIALFIHFFAFLAILIMVSDTPQMGNGALYGFAYIYLMGNPVEGDLLIKRGIVMLIGYVICGAILFAKHKNKNKEIRFYHIAKKFDLQSEKSCWQIRLALGIAIILTLGRVFNVAHFMWAGFTCSSLLSSYPVNTNVKPRFIQRIIGSVMGTLLFLIVFRILPVSLHPLLGPLGGICYGFCTDYKYKTAINCIGAIFTATSLYDVNAAAILRVSNNIFGVVVGITFAFVFNYLMEQHLQKESAI